MCVECWVHLAKCVQWSENEFWELVPSFTAGFLLLCLPFNCVLSVSLPVSGQAILSLLPISPKEC